MLRLQKTTSQAHIKNLTDCSLNNFNIAQSVKGWRNRGVCTEGAAGSQALSMTEGSRRSQRQVPHWGLWLKQLMSRCWACPIGLWSSVPISGNQTGIKTEWIRFRNEPLWLESIIYSERLLDLHRFSQIELSTDFITIYACEHREQTLGKKRLFPL